MGAISMPDMAPMPTASVNVSEPDMLVLMPTSRAPRRFTAVARSARPYSVLPKNSHKATINSAQVATTNRLCADQVMNPRSTCPLTNAGVRQPSAPKNTSARPMSAKWTATETISSTRTVASANGW
ncbi:hypothetical protein D3C72_2050140 [compost metagenome]